MASPVPVYALVGEDVFLQLRKLSSLLATLPPNTQRIDADGERVELSELLDELRSYSMFSSSKVVVVRNAEMLISRYREQLEDYLSHPANSSVLMLRVPKLPGNERISKLIAKVGKVEDCNPPKDVARWSADHAAKEHKLSITPAAARMLVELIGDDLGRIDNELAKLALQYDNTKVDVPQVTQSVAFQREQEMKELSAEVATGQTTQAIRRWRQLIQLDPSTEFRAVTWLAMWLADVSAVLYGGPGAQKLAWAYRDRLPQFTANARKLGKAGLARALDLLVEVDRQNKSGIGEASTNVERFLLTVGAGK
ncbi:MAG: DNA polymerase III subunit delta [Phycisphaerales bacterium]|nr:DNA polymerase III subunit delta [Phycisphaerales bacterium]